MKKFIFLAVLILLFVPAFYYVNGNAFSQAKNEVQENGAPQIKEDNQVPEDKHLNDETDKKAVAAVVESFGKKLQMVSLLAPQDIVSKSMQENYGGLVSPALLSQWQSDPQNAPGRLVSSPWPDRIEILSIEKSPEGTYAVKGDIIEITSVEIEKGGAAAKRPVTLTVKSFNNGWLIDAITLGAYRDNGSILYKNGQYGFDFSLPGSWTGYKIITDKWEGLAFDEQKGEKVTETGPLISIRHPGWTSQNQRQDIPIMVFTTTQWDELQKGNFHIGAAPVGPSELERNSKYVFALPARYNFAFPAGYEEVENILNSNPLQILR